MTMHTAIRCPECGSETYRAEGQTTCVYCEGTGINLAVRLAREILNKTEAGEYGGLDRIASELAVLLADIRRGLIAERAAVYIAHELQPRAQAGDGVDVVYPGDRHPPTTVEDIERELLDGCLWVSWMDDRVLTAMRRIHGDPGTAPVAEPIA